MGLNFNKKENYNLIIKIIMGMFVLNLILVMSMMFQNYMFYKANFDKISQVQNITQNVNIDNEPIIDKININTCSYEALDSLYGIGEVKARKIISNRPYNDIYELIKVVGENTFYNIKDKITT